MKDRIAVRDEALNIAYMNNRAAQLKSSKNSEKTAYANELKVGENCAVANTRKKKI